MRKLLTATLGAFLALTLSLPLAAQQNVPASKFASPAQGRDRDDQRNERHPHIRAAIRELNEAKRELQSAAHDFGGHRADAVKACDEAIHQLQLALQYDKK
jgi:hypothetical protein